MMKPHVFDPKNMNVLEMEERKKGFTALKKHYLTYHYLLVLSKENPRRSHAGACQAK